MDLELDAPAEMIAHTAERYGGLDILVNNLGGPPPGDRLPHAGFLSREAAGPLKAGRPSRNPYGVVVDSVKVSVLA
jgi:NAD(P)-dependent dehydrogenase (short-subunit alcohol dehydrogenase family)